MVVLEMVVVLVEDGVCISDGRGLCGGIGGGGGRGIDSCSDNRLCTIH